MLLTMIGYDLQRHPVEDRKNGGFGGLGGGRAREGKGVVVGDGDLEFDRHSDGDLFQGQGESGFRVVNLGFIVSKLVDELVEGVEGTVVVGFSEVGKEIKVGSHGNRKNRFTNVIKNY